MVMERLRRHPDNKGPIRKLGIKVARGILAITGVKDPDSKSVRPLKTESPKVYPEISLEAEWTRQTQKFVELGFHRELGLTEQRYIASLPKFEPQPKEFKGRLDTPFLVETRVPIERQATLAGIDYFLAGLDKKDWTDDPQGYKTPNIPYATWTDEGKRFMNRKMGDVRKELAPDERGGTELDGVALLIAKPNILQTRFLDLPGTSVRSASAAYLFRWGGRVGLGHGFVGGAFPRFGSLVCGRKN